jgi:hypothetical protein
LLTVGVEGFVISFDYTQTHTTVSRTPLDEGSAHRRDLYLTTQTLYKRQKSMPAVGSEPTIPASARPQTYSLDRPATGIGTYFVRGGKKSSLYTAVCEVISCPTPYFPTQKQRICVLLELISKGKETLRLTQLQSRMWSRNTDTRNQAGIHISLSASKFRPTYKERKVKKGK